MIVPCRRLHPQRFTKGTRRPFQCTIYNTIDDQHRSSHLNALPGRLIVVRHGQSVWNKGSNQLERFTGWTNVGLSENGQRQAVQAARKLHGYLIDCAYVSLLQRSQTTLRHMLEELNDQGRRSEGYDDLTTDIPVISSWRLNERHYGALTGQSKLQAEQLFGKAQLDLWRYSYKIPPPPMDPDTFSSWKHQAHCQMATYIHHRHNRSRVIEKGNSVWDSSRAVMPRSEAFFDVLQRIVPLWKYGIAPRLARGETVLLVGHANSVKALLCLLDPHTVTPTSFGALKIPNTTPLVYQLIRDYPGASTSVPASFPVLGDLRVVIPPSNSTRYPLSGTWLEDPPVARDAGTAVEEPNASVLG